jgi:putative transposase
MPRRQRELEDGGIYHVYSRGNNRQRLFRGEADFEKYLELLKRSRERYAFRLYHYCLMSNHVHLLLEIMCGKDLARVMHDLQLGYARYYKKQYKYTGHLYQGRYRSPRIPGESYYLQCGRYIERNPVKTGLVSQAEDYKYSSAAYYVLGQRNDLITPNRYYAGMGRTETERQAAYRELVRLEEPYSDMVTAGLQRV